MRCGPSRFAIRTTSLKHAFASWSAHLPRAVALAGRSFLILVMLTSVSQSRGNCRREQRSMQDFEVGVPNGIRTRVAAVKGRCPRPLDDGDVFQRGARKLARAKLRSQRGLNDRTASIFQPFR